MLRFFPNLFDRCPRLGGQLESSAESKKFDKVVLDRKKSVTFYDVLSTRQKEKMLIEEAQMRNRLGVSHLSDDAVKGLMLALINDSKKPHSQDISTYLHN